MCATFQKAKIPGSEQLKVACAVPLTKMMVAIPIALRVMSVAVVGALPLVYAAGDNSFSPSEFQRYQSRQELALEHEQSLHEERNPPASPEETQRQRRRFEAERIHQRQLLERQRRRVAAERVRLRPVSASKSSRGITLQQLNREQASERLSRKLLR